MQLWLFGHCGVRAREVLRALRWRCSSDSSANRTRGTVAGIATTTRREASAAADIDALAAEPVYLQAPLLYRAPVIRLGVVMELSAFIRQQMPAILSEWEHHASTMTPAANSMDVEALRDHAELMLRAVAADIETAQTAQQSHEKSLGGQDDESETSAAAKHGALRHNSQFTLLQLNSEFRALRSSVLRLWLPRASLDGDTIDSIIRFNEAIDQALAESIVTFSRQSDITRDTFVGILGHDLRGPLATMTMSAGLLGDSNLTPERTAKLASAMKRATQQMTAMINDLLGVTSAKLGGGIPVLREPGDLRNVVEGALQDAQAMHQNATYALKVTGDVSGTFDAVRLHQLLVNLLGNAAQHGVPDEPVRVLLSGEDAALHVSVTNKGAEIPGDQRERLFAPMVQRRGRDSGGSATSLGLGLYVAREIAHGHGGSITVSTAPGENTFTVTLPRHPPTEKQ